MNNDKEIITYTKDTHLKKQSSMILIKNKMTAVEHHTYNYLQKIVQKDIDNKDIDIYKKDFVFKTTFKEIQALMNITNSRDVKKALDGLMANFFSGNNVVLKRGQEKYSEMSCQFLSHWKVEDNTRDIIEFEFPKPVLKLMEESKIFADLDLVEMSKLKKKHSLWLYEMINDYIGLGEKVYSVDDVRFLSGKDTMRVSQIKTHIIDIAMKEINDKTSFKIDCIVQKRGRNIESYRFLFLDESGKYNKEDTYKAWLKHFFLNKKLPTSLYGDITFKSHKNKVYMFRYESKKIIETVESNKIYDYLYLKKNDVFKDYQALRKDEGKVKSKFKNIKDLLSAFENRLK